MALDAFEAARAGKTGEAARNSIEHVEAARDSDLARFPKLDVTATMQPLHLMYTEDSLKVKLGEKRARHQYAVKSMLAKGVNVAFSTDYPVASFEPLINIYFAVTRCTPQGRPVEDPVTENVTLAQALKAYTYGSAYCLNAEKKLGTLEEGKLADLIVYDNNLFAANPKELLKTQVDLTMVDGVIVYKKERF